MIEMGEENKLSAAIFAVRTTAGQERNVANRIGAKSEMDKLRVVLDYLPCDLCKEINTKEQNYLCTVCRRLDRIVITEKSPPRWKMEEDTIVSVEEREGDDLKPKIKFEAKKIGEMEKF